LERPYLWYCDDSCLGNPGPGGWAYRVWQGRRVLRAQSGTEQNATNNRMELRAAIEGLKSFPPASNIVVVSDSRYLISGMTDLLPLWQARYWRSSNGPAIRNQALWQDLIAASKQHKVRWHVPCHARVVGQSPSRRCWLSRMNTAPGSTTCLKASTTPVPRKSCARSQSLTSKNCRQSIRRVATAATDLTGAPRFMTPDHATAELYQKALTGEAPYKSVG
jgi:ribonuclease HI